MQNLHHQVSLQLRSSETAENEKVLSMKNEILSVRQVERLTANLSATQTVTIIRNPTLIVDPTGCCPVIVVPQPLKRGLQQLFGVMYPIPDK